MLGTIFLTHVTAKSRAALRSPLTLIVLTLLLQACTHSRLVKTADVFQNEQRYELAADHYRQALSLRPNNLDTLEKLHSAEDAFDRWLSELEGSANLAYENNLNGKAVLFYGKLANHSNDPFIMTRYEELLSSLRDYAQFYVNIDYDPLSFGTDLEQGITDLTPLSQALNTPSTQANNEQNVSFAFEQGAFSLQEHEVYESDHYISGYQYVDNPELLSLQRNLPNLRFHLRESRYDVHRYRDFVRANENDLNRLEHRRDGINEDDEDAINDADSAVQHASSRLHRSQRKLGQYRRELDERRRQLDYSISRMSYLPLTVREDIYSEHVYPVMESTLNLDGHLLVDNSGASITLPLTVSSFDVYYDAQPIINLLQDPLVHIADTQLEVELNAQARSEARQHLRGMVTQYRQGLLIEANTAATGDARLEGWVIYGLSGNSGVSAPVARKMTQHLQREIGVGGELAINRLLRP